MSPSLAYPSPLAGRRAWVGGASRGIGRACAEEFARLGAHTCLIGRDGNALADALDSVRGLGPGADHDSIQLDYANPEAVGTVAADYQAQTGPVHILLNNSGGPPAGLACEASPETFELWFRIHLITNQVLVQSTLPSMKAAGFGRIINIISTSVKQPIPRLGVSNTVRGAVANWAKTLAGEVAMHGITVNNVLPGTTQTQRLDAIVASRAASGGVSESEAAAAMKREIPAGRFGTAAEIAAVVGFLATPAAAYVTGINLPVDGGRTGCL